MSFDLILRNVRDLTNLELNSSFFKLRIPSHQEVSDDSLFLSCDQVDITELLSIENLLQR